jgi:hypothetical protein
MSSLKPRFNHATVVAYLALFVALGGSAYAAATITSRDIVNGSITGADIRTGSVKSADVSGITGADLGAGAPWTLRSPDRRFSLSVSNSGITMQGPSSKVTLDATTVAVEGTARTEVRSSGQVQVQGATVQVGGLIGLNGTCAPVANAQAIQPHAHVVSPEGGTTSTYQPPPAAFTNVLAC